MSKGTSTVVEGMYEWYRNGDSEKYGNKILKILFYSYGCLALVYNVANLCIMSSSLKIIDFDLMLQIVDSLFIFFTSVGWIYCFVLGGD